MFDKMGEPLSTKERRRNVRPLGVEEKRHFIRTEAAIPLTLYIKDKKLTEGIQTVTRNISATGIMIEVDERLPAGAEVKIELNAPGSANPVHCAGKIVWSAQISEADRYNTGIEFVKIEEDNKNTFLKFLCDIIYKTTSSPR